MSLTFNRYNSLIPLEKEKFVHSVKTQGLHTGEWVATEKIHGCNFSFHTDGDISRKAIRSKFIGDQGFKGSLQVEYMVPDVFNVYSRLEDSGILENGDTMSIYGELFGGMFFGTKSEGAKNVQGGMDYHPDTKFMACDIVIFPDDGEEDSSYTLSYTEMLEALDGLIPVVPELARGTFDEISSLNPEFPSKVPEYYGLAIPEGKSPANEGFVIRPVDGEKYKGDHRCIFKKRNAKFSETSKVSKKPKEACQIPEVHKELYEELSGYINLNRLESVTSKLEELTWPMFGKISGLLLQDAKIDYEFENTIEAESWTAIRKPLAKLCESIVREYLADKKKET